MNTFWLSSLGIGALFLLCIPTADATDRMTTAPEVQRLVERYGPRLLRARYMEQGRGQPVTWPGWEGFPTRLYRYSRTDSATGITKHASVVMLNAQPERIARWVVSACAEARHGQIRQEDTNLLFERVLDQSGGQFAVAGVVYEDMLPADGRFETYCFRDGVTVAVEGVPYRGTDPLDDQTVSYGDSSIIVPDRIVSLLLPSPEVAVVALEHSIVLCDLQSGELTEVPVATEPAGISQDAVGIWCRSGVRPVGCAS